MHLRRHRTIASNQRRVVEPGTYIFLSGRRYRGLLQDFFIENLISKSFLLQIEYLLQFHFLQYTFSLSLLFRVHDVAVLDLSLHTVLRWLHLRVGCGLNGISLAVSIDKWHFRSFFKNHFLRWWLNVALGIMRCKWVASFDVAAHQTCLKTSTPERPGLYNARLEPSCVRFTYVRKCFIARIDVLDPCKQGSNQRLECLG